MNPSVRVSIAIAAISAVGLVYAVDPPAGEGLDLGAMKLKKAQPAAAPTALPAVQQTSTQKQPVGVPIGAARPGAVAATTAAAPAPQAAAAPPAPGPTGVGNTVSALGQKKAIDILAEQQAQNTPAAQQQQSGDLQIKKPLFKK